MEPLFSWLKQLGLERYAKVLDDNGVDLESLSLLSDAELEKLGVLLGHRKKLMNALGRHPSNSDNPDAPSPSEPFIVVPTATSPIEGERRALTVLFSDLTGYTAMNEYLDPEVVGEILGEIKVEAVRIVESFGGIVNQFVGDEILALFGVPVAHEDDPVRAVRAALALHTRVRELSAKVESRIGATLRLHSGIDTGLVVTNSRDTRDGTYGITGDTVNTGARLASAAPADDVWIAPSTHALISEYFDTQPQAPVNLKGKAGPLQPYRVLGVSRTDTRFEAARRRGLSAYTGRKAELTLMQASLDHVVGGDGQFVAVIGEAGAGKSRLLFEFRSGLDREHLEVAEGRCQSYGAETPYLPFLDAMRRALNLREEDSPEVLHDKIVSQVTAIDVSLESFLPHYMHLLSANSSRYALPATLQGGERRRAFEESLVTFFTLSAKHQPRVLILEDWHWADATSDSVLKHLVGLVAQYPLMVVLLTRPEYDLKWANPPLATLINLKPLSVSETGALACTALGVASLPEALSSLIHQRTGGNPLFIEEVCHALVEEKILSVRDNQASLTRALETVQLPDTVQAVIRSRVDRLDRPARELLQLAAVIGREFARTLLEKIPTSAARLGDTLELLRSQDLIRQVRVVPEAEYIFKHVLTQIVVYETLLHMRRRALHELVGQAIEEVYAERIEEHYESLAYHYQRSDNTDKAILFLELSGDKAKARFVLQQTVKNYVQAIELIRAQEMTPALMRKYIDIAVKWADMIVPSQEVIAALRTAQSYSQTLGDDERFAQTTSYLGQLLLYIGDAQAAEPELMKVISMAGRLENQDRVGSSLRCLGQLKLFCYAEIEEALEYVRRALPIVRRSKNRFEESCSHGLLGLEHGLKGKFSESFTHFDTALGISKESKEHSITCWNLAWKVQNCFLLRQWDEALQMLQEGKSLAQRIENFWAENWFDLFKAYVYIMRGDGDNASAIDLGRRSAEAVRNTGSYSAAAVYLAALLEAAGHHNDAYGFTNNLLIDISRFDLYFGAECRATRIRGLAAAHLATPDWNAIFSDMERSIANAKCYGWRPDQAISHYHYAEVLLRKGDTAEAIHQLSLATDLFSSVQMTQWLEKSKLIAAQLQ